MPTIPLTFHRKLCYRPRKLTEVTRDAPCGYGYLSPAVFCSLLAF